MSKYLYATLVEVDGQKEVKPGKQQEKTKKTIVVEDGQLKGRLEHKLKVVDLPEPMTEEEVVEWVKDNHETVFATGDEDE